MGAEIKSLRSENAMLDAVYDALMNLLTKIKTEDVDGEFIMATDSLLQTYFAVEDDL